MKAGSQTPQKNAKPREATNIWELEEASRLLHFRVLERRLAEIWSEFAEAGFEPILIKGWAAAQLYPKPWERLFTDVDLAFDPKDFEKARRFLAERNFSPPVDLHSGLRHLDTVGFEKLRARSVFRKCGKTDIRVLCAEDHLRVLIVHWLNDGGAVREKLFDIYHAVANRPADFDWEECLGAVSRRRRRWIICAIGLARRYLDLPVGDLPFKDELDNMPGWLIKTVEREWASGVRLRGLAECRHDKKELWRQLKKRIPPNALQATIETEGDFDSRPRIYYQALDTFKRLSPWVARVRKKFGMKFDERRCF